MYLELSSLNTIGLAARSTVQSSTYQKVSVLIPSPRSPLGKIPNPKLHLMLCHDLVSAVSSTKAPG